MKYLKVFAKELGVRPETVRKHFARWAVERGVPISKFYGKIVLVTKRGPRYHRVLWIPPEAQEYIKRVISETKGDKRHLKHRLGVVTTVDLAKRLGTTPRRIRTEFKWWCYTKGYEPKDFLISGVGFALPADFVNYILEKYGGGGDGKEGGAQS